ncbi:uncharacterized protein LOC142542244 isoform X2 [Primulina tabacum]|uniref:uncharacterized protein LOC142542244 isoform X2 n=1 Tax=Primulina tabacum TaxID=48773 RepID=UPI003F5A9CD8
MDLKSGLYGNVFYFCAGRCRHNSESVVHENAYLSEYHHCFTIPSNSSGLYEIDANSLRIQVRAGSQNLSHGMTVGDANRSCYFCPAYGSSGTQVKARLVGINIIIGSIQKYMSCKGSCLSSVGGLELVNQLKL